MESSYTSHVVIAVAEVSRELVQGMLDPLHGSLIVNADVELNDRVIRDTVEWPATGSPSDVQQHTGFRLVQSSQLADQDCGVDDGVAAQLRIPARVSRTSSHDHREVA